MKRQAKGLAAALVLMGFPASAFADDLPWWMGERRIIGENNLEPIEDTIGTDAYDKASVVARVETVGGDGFCTSSRVAEDLFLTNFHCYDYKPCEEIQFHLGYERDLPSAEQTIFKCKEVLSTNLNLDYALYRVEVAGDDPIPGDTITRDHTYSNLGSPIPDDDVTGVSEVFELDQEGSIVDLTVKIRIEHTYVGDLKVTLISPAGTAVVLHDRAGGGADDIDRTYAGSDGLAALRGETVSGTWTLAVQDLAGEDIGSIEEVSFNITTAVADGEKLEKVFPVVTLWGGAIEIGQKLLVASHPAARLKEIDRSDNCVLRTIETEVVSERETITHTCDTEGGSSGSPILDRATGYQLALHWGGTNEFNLSIPMNLILDHLEANLEEADYAALTIAR